MLTEESPWSFRETITFHSGVLHYSDMAEACQGGPVVGHVRIQGKDICPRFLFGGPSLMKDGVVLLPLFERRLFSTGFRLFAYNMATQEYQIGVEKFPLLWLVRWDDAGVCCRLDAQGERERILPVPG